MPACCPNGAPAQKGFARRRLPGRSRHRGNGQLLRNAPGPKLWDDPLRFDPDRFLPERSQGRSRWQYLPFGGGPRSCIGDHFAMLEATLALATIIRAARIESLGDDFPLATPFTVVAAAPIDARVHARTSTPVRPWSHDSPVAQS